jgi:hypothetical protein
MRLRLIAAAGLSAAALVLTATPANAAGLSGCSTYGATEGHFIAAAGQQQVFSGQVNPGQGNPFFEGPLIGTLCNPNRTP